MNKFKRKILVLALLPTSLVIIVALVETIQQRGLVNVFTAWIFAALSLAIWTFIRISVNNEAVAPLEALQGNLENTEEINQELQDTLRQMDSVNIQMREALDTAKRNFAEEAVYVSQLTSATRAPLNSVIAFTNLLVNSNHHREEYLYELQRSGRQLTFLLEELHAECRAGGLETVFSLIQAVDDTLACIHPLAISRGHEIFFIAAQSCPDHLYGVEPQLKAVLFHYLLQQLSEGLIEHHDLLLEANYSDQGDLIFVLTPIKEPATQKGNRLENLLEECDASLEDGLLTIAARPAHSPPVFSGKMLKASIIDDRISRARSLESRLTRLGIRLLDPLDQHGADLCFLGRREQSADDAGFSRPTVLLDNTTAVHETHVTPLRKPIDHGELVRLIETLIPANAGTADLHVLAVDDNEPNLRLSRLLLEEMGFNVHTATDGLEAVRLATQRKLDLVIMDLQMPVLDGLQATRKIRKELGEQLPIIALSANLTEQDRTRLLSAGMNDVLIKPLGRAQLEEILGKWLARTSKPADEAVAPPIFDRNLALKLANANADLANELFQLLLSGLPRDQMKINEARSLHDSVIFRETIHKLNGAARYCGVPRLARAIDKLETRSKTSSGEDIEIAMDTFNAEIKALLAWHRENPDPFAVVSNQRRYLP